MNKQAMQRALNELNNALAQLMDADGCDDVTEMLEKAGAALELEIAKAQKQWYVFDKRDCIGEYSMAATAAIEATRLANDNCDGVHILHLTEAEKDAYCNYGIDTLRGVICN